MRQISSTCKICGASFSRPFAWTKNRKSYSGGNFCSHACSAKGRKKRKKTWLSSLCAICGVMFFYRKGATGSFRYCSNECRMLGQKNPFKRIPIPRTPSTRKRYRKSEDRAAIEQAKRDHKSCVRCGSQDNLQGHHKKHYAKHPELRCALENIEVLCANCHAKEHPEIANFIHIPRIKSGKMLPCETCGKPYYRSLGTINGSRFCSPECRHKSLTKVRTEDIINLFESGLSQAAIARMLGVTDSTIWRHKWRAKRSIKEAHSAL